MLARSWIIYGGLVGVIACGAAAGVVGRDWLAGDEVEIPAPPVVSNAEAKQDRLQVAALPANAGPPDLRSALEEDLAAEPPIEIPMLPMARPKSVNPGDVSYSLLSDSQINALKQRLKLTGAQERHWPGIETALRSVARKVHDNRHSRQGAELDAVDIQQLQDAAKPLLAQLREDQKRELRQLARVIGLEAVAARI